MGVFCVKSWSKSCVENWSQVFSFTGSPFFKCFWACFKNTNSVTSCQNSVFAKLSGCQKWGFRKENSIFCFCLFYVGDRESEKETNNKMEKGPKTYKNCILWWSSKNGKSEKMLFFLVKIAWHYLCQEGRENAHFRAHDLFWPTIFLAQNSVNQEKYGFSGNCLKPKLTPFFEKHAFLTWVKKWFLLTVFLESCVSWKHNF